MYQRVTRDIEVTVSPRFMPEKSSAEKGLYFWPIRSALRTAVRSR
jgi:ApaG protein